MPAEKPMQPTDAWEVTRRIKVSILSHATDADAVKDAVSALPGVRDVTMDADRHQVVVHYDTSKSSYREILKALQGAGLAPADSWWNRLKGGWYQYTDENARDNAKAPTPACCNKPPK